MNIRPFVVRLAVMSLLIASPAVADDWPQFRGPNQDGISREKMSIWPAAGPKLLWKAPSVPGWGSFAISGDKAFIVTGRENNGVTSEVCLALDAATGQELWAAEIKQGVKFATNTDHGGSEEKGEYGPGSTPTVSDGKVYVYSLDMLLCCLDAKTGKEIWRVDVMKDHDGILPWYGNYSSPVLAGNEVIVAGGGPGQFALGFNKDTGKLVWKSGTAINQCSTPLITTIHGVPQLVFYLKNDLMGISLQDHKTLWRSAVAQHNGHAAMQPVALEDKVYTGSFTEGTAVYQVLQEDGGFYSKRLWFNGSRDSGWIGTPVLKDGYLYTPVDWYRAGYACIEFATGKVMWKKTALTKGGPILIGDNLIFLTENGSLILVEPKPEYKELARFDKAIAGKCFSTPSFSNGRLYLRSGKDGACYDLTAK